MSILTGRSRAARVIARMLPALLALELAASAASGTDASTLEERAVAIDHVVTEPDGARVVVGHVSRKLHISSDTLQDQRAQTGLGWGELLVAHLIAKMAALDFDQVVGEFHTGADWEGIARLHRVNLEKLDAEVAQSQEIVEQREEDRAPTTTSNSTGSPSRPGGPAHGQTGNPAGGKGRHRGSGSTSD